MKSFALIVWIGLAGMASFALFNITFKVERLESELTALNKQILKEQRAVHVLRAEWSYLNRPERIESLTRKLLPHLRSPEAFQIGDLDSLGDSARSARTAGNVLVPHIRPATSRGRR
jgi:hypothetical protein